MTEVYIVSATRTPLGRFGGGLSGFSPADLGAHAMKAALAKAGVSGENLDLYIFGNVLRAGHGQLIPRQAALKAGIPATVDGYAIDMVCSSAMMSLINGCYTIKAGEADLVLAGGTECMSQTGFFLSHRARWGYKFLMGAPEQLMDILLYDGLTDSTTGDGMGDETERLAAEHGFSRQALDEVAFYSQKRAAEATEKGLFKNEISPIEVSSRKGTQVIDTDEGIRAETTLESLAKLRPAFQKDGVLTAGNSSQISDGAAAIILASEAAVQKYGLKPLAKVLGGAWAGGESWRFPEVPILATQKLLGRLKMSVNDFDLFENNEAFAVSTLLFDTMLGVSQDKLNVNGGAIALGHPIGASGSRIVVTLLNALEQHDKSLGLAALCHGTGGGTAFAIERV
ncbi:MULTISPECIES: acetyl-CoA acetyltransferase PhaA [Arthrospira]|uniref:acetyl-CoA C-acetyltransferase n=2 Tax=Limnospira platensis TaxID=118562 RepID=A0A5M3SZ05_LIMPL|nr:acetyl-CoA acetyltransferase PhaA [Arthrospira platensis]KDR56711.1 acetyl-CoA acetyltransferase [Arthrospira platensis str. Paraca]MBD2671382.1 thiolase family protein [Arthrospira platensis FACHB-439]MBD2712334.1 thiolase family protein [Arthrospira platensis FACHB-835]MDF2212244.1 thiolase family protein [Arthrospira platensis NCB002]MDT9184889.1 thiolase family protein [Limnospira sp. PMC 289.06]MDT9297157.1 thiolase family protein [Arthrospira platensis PCC 7345]MDT9312180.1 thiolase